LQTESLNQKRKGVGSMKIRITFGELLDKGLWDDYCNLTGLNPYCMAEGQADSDEEVNIDAEQAKQWGLI